MLQRIIGCSTLVLLATGCQDLEAPLAKSLQPPTTVSKTVGAPDVTYGVSNVPLSTMSLYNFAHDTWVITQAAGLVGFTAENPVAGASVYYVFPPGTRNANGVVDQRSGSGCALKLTFFNGSQTINSSFGPCGTDTKMDTTKMQGAVTLKRGPIPYNYAYDCDIWGVKVCHGMQSGWGQSVRQTPIPVALNKLKASRQTMDTTTHPTTTFTASFSPESLTVAGLKQRHPFYITLWQWIGGDQTRNPLSGCVSTNLICNYAPYESGTMVNKMFVGGWEQTTSVTVQCLLTPADSVLNDSTNNFAVRTALREALIRSNADSAPGAGYDSILGRGWRHETGIVVWMLPNGGGFTATPYEDPHATECNMHFDPIALGQQAPVPGATPQHTGHVHPSIAGENVYGCDSTQSGNSHIRLSKHPGDGLVVPTKVRDDSTGGGSPTDWKKTTNEQISSYVMGKEGSAWRLDPTPDSLPNYQNPNHWPTFGPAAGKCTWPKPYTQ